MSGYPKMNICANSQEKNSERTCGGCAESTEINRTWIRCEHQSERVNGVYCREVVLQHWLPGCGSWKGKS